MLHEQRFATTGGNQRGAEFRATLLSLAAAGVAWGGLQVLPQAGMEVFARGAALMAGWLTGAHPVRVDDGWLLAEGTPPVVVSEACSATGYFIIVAALLGWRLARGGRGRVQAAALAIAAAFPLTLAINALRVVVVMQAHRWVIPRLPEADAPFLHLLAGVAVFLPALIGLNLLLESHAILRQRSR